MSILKEVQETAINKEIPRLRVGQTVKVHQKIKEGNKERVQIFEGLIIKMNSGYGADKSFTVRKVVEGVGVEKTFPVYSPLIDITVVKVAKVRRAKLYYMRDRSGKSARLKETFVNKVEMVPAAASQAKPVKEEKVEEVAEAPNDAPVE